METLKMIGDQLIAFSTWLWGPPMVIILFVPMETH